MRYKGIIEITMNPEIPDPNGESLLNKLTGAGFEGVLGVRSGKVIEVEFEAEPQAAPDLLEQMCQQLLANPVTEQFAYRLQMIADQGFGETTVRYSTTPEGVVGETPMRYAVGEHDVRVHEFKGKFPKIGDFEFLRAEWNAKHPVFVLVRYAVKGEEQKYGIRMDLDKRCFLDDLPDPSADSILKGMAHSIWDEICLGIKAQAPYEEPE